MRTPGAYIPVVSVAPDIQNIEQLRLRLNWSHFSGTYHVAYAHVDTLQWLNYFDLDARALHSLPVPSIVAIPFKTGYFKLWKRSLSGNRREVTYSRNHQWLK